MFIISNLPGFACDFLNDGVVSKLCRELCRFEILVLIVIVIEYVNVTVNDARHSA